MAVPIRMLVDIWGEEFGPELQDMLKQGDIYHKENVKEGCVGTITTFLVCNSDGHDRRVISWAGHDPEGWGDAGKDWFGDLVRAVEEGCGRLPSK